MNPTLKLWIEFIISLFLAFFWASLLLNYINGWPETWHVIGAVVSILLIFVFVGKAEEKWSKL